MNKRLYLYCTLLLCIMSCVMLYTVYDASRALISGYTVGTNMTNLEIKAQKRQFLCKIARIQRHCKETNGR